MFDNRGQYFTNPMVKAVHLDPPVLSQWHGDPRFARKFISLPDYLAGTLRFPTVEPRAELVGKVNHVYIFKYDSSIKWRDQVVGKFRGSYDKDRVGL